MSQEVYAVIGDNGEVLIIYRNHAKAERHADAIGGSVEEFTLNTELPEWVIDYETQPESEEYISH